MSCVKNNNKKNHSVSGTGLVHVLRPKIWLKPIQLGPSRQSYSQLLGILLLKILTGPKSYIHALLCMLTGLYMHPRIHTTYACMGASQIHDITLGAYSIHN